MTTPQPYLIPNSMHRDVRGSNTKIFGITPEIISTPDFRVNEVFMTTNRNRTLRGLYGQSPAMGKLLFCITGGARVNAVCIDPHSDMVGRVVTHLLHPEAGKLHIPRGWVDGYLSLMDDTRILYLADEDYNPQGNMGIHPLDPELGLYWGDDVTPETVILRESDMLLPTLSQFLGETR